METVETVFAYGTLKDPKIQKEVIGRKISGTIDHLDKCIKSHFQHGTRKTYPVLLCNVDGPGVDGLVFEITPDELLKIDMYEKDVYHREKVTLKSGISAWAYVK